MGEPYDPKADHDSEHDLDNLSTLSISTTEENNEPDWSICPSDYDDITTESNGYYAAIEQLLLLKDHDWRNELKTGYPSIMITPSVVDQYKMYKFDATVYKNLSIPFDLDFPEYMKKKGLKVPMEI